jgi:hypothetical protein
MQEVRSERKKTVGLLVLVAAGLLTLPAALLVPDLLTLPAALLVPDLAFPTGLPPVETAIVSANTPGTMTAIFEMYGILPTDGSRAFGYGVMTSDGSHMIVTTTHAGILDSEAQKSAADPVFHNHFVLLTDASTVSQCNANGGIGGARLQVAALTFQSPGNVYIDGSHVIHTHVILTNVPDNFNMDNALGGTMSGSRGGNVESAVSFTLEPVFDESGNLTNVCVENITKAHKLNIE